MIDMHVRVGAAGNGVPVFMIAGAHQAFGRPFGAVYDPERRLFMYPAFYPASSRVLADLDVMSRDFHVSFSDAAKKHVKYLQDVKESLAGRALPAGFDFVTKPYDHQVEGLCQAWWCLRSALFFEPGLGKSKVAVDLIRLQRHGGKRGTALVLGPLVTVVNWGREIDKHSGGALTWRALQGTPKERTAILEELKASPPDVVLLTYDTARIMTDEVIREVSYDTVIADESHGIKSWTSARTVAAYELAQKAARRVVMTGSPTQGDPRDVYGQFKFLGDCFMPEDYGAFKRKFLLTPGDNPRSHVVVGYKNLDVLNGRVNLLALRRTKAECLDLPEQVIVDVEYDLTRTQKVLHNQIHEEMVVDPRTLEVLLFGDPTTLPPAAQMAHRAVVLTKLLQVSSGFLMTSAVEGAPASVTVLDENPKLEALVDLLKEVLSDDARKVIVWCRFRKELDLVQARMADEGWGCVRVDGDNSHEAQDLIDQFTADRNLRVYLAQASTGVGVTINAATYMVFYSLPFSLTTYSQDLDRNYRIGQTEKVTVYRLIGRGTPERAIAKLLDVKVDVDQALTHRMDCLSCPKNLECIAKNVVPFDPDCVYKRSIAKPVTRARSFDVTEEPKK